MDLFLRNGRNGDFFYEMELQNPNLISNISFSCFNTRVSQYPVLNATVVKELRRKEGQKKGSRYERINTIYILTYLFRPLAHMSKRRARFDVGCLKAWW